MSLEIDFVSSPNHSGRRGVAVDAVVIHYTAAGAARGSIRWFQMPESRASSHYVIERDGDITRMVKLSRAAWHAGVSELEGSRGVNRRSIGIELANCGLLVEEHGEFFWQQGRTLREYRGPEPIGAELVFENADDRVAGYWEPYPDAQINALQALLQKLEAIGYGDAARNPVGHEEIAIPYGKRKFDPGPLFPWERFARKLERRSRRG